VHPSVTHGGAVAGEWRFRTPGRADELGEGLFNAIGVFCGVLEERFQIARSNGAFGAKLTGGGGGGAMTRLCPEEPGRVCHAMKQAGYYAMEVRIG